MLALNRLPTCLIGGIDHTCSPTPTCMSPLEKRDLIGQTHWNSFQGLAELERCIERFVRNCLLQGNLKGAEFRGRQLLTSGDASVEITIFNGVRLIWDVRGL